MSRRWRKRRIVKTPLELRDLLSDKRNHFTMIRVTQFVLDNMTAADYDLASKCDVILYRTN